MYTYFLAIWVPAIPNVDANWNVFNFLPTKRSFPDSTAIKVENQTSNRGSKAFIRVCVCVSVYPHDKTKTAETAINKLVTGTVHHEWSPRPPINIRSTGQRSRSQGHKVEKTYWRRSSGRRELCTLIECSASSLISHSMRERYILVIIKSNQIKSKLFLLTSNLHSQFSRAHAKTKKEIMEN